MSDIIVGSVGVRLVPNAEGFTAKAKAATQGLTANVKLDADTAPADAKIEKASRKRKAKIEADADTAAADAKLDRAARTRTAKIKAETSGLDRVVKQLDGLPGGFGLLGSAVIGLGPALVPITAAAAGLTAALGAPLVAAGGGATLYALIAGKAVKDTEAQSKAIDQLKKKMDAAKVSAQSATTAAGKKSALATLATDTKAYNAALDKLNPAQAAFIKAQGSLKSAFTDLERSAGPAIFGPLTNGMQALSTLLPKVGPVLKPVSAAISGLLDEVERSAKSGAVNDFLKFLAATSGPAITQGGHILGNIALGFAAIGKAFAPLGMHLGDSIEQWSRSFAKIGSSNGLKDFVGYVSKEGPQVARTLGDVAGAVGHIAKALAPIGRVSLQGLDGLARGVSGINTKVLTVAAGAFASIALSLKAISIAKGGLSAISKVGSLVGLGGKSGGLATVEGALGKVGAKGVVPVYVTNEGFGGKGGPGGVIPGGAGGAASEEGKVGRFAKILGPLAAVLGPLGIGVGVGSVANSLGLNPFKGESDRNKAIPGNPFSSAGIAADGAKKAAAATKEWTANQRALNLQLADIGPYGTALHKLPAKVQTKIETPGAVQSVTQIAALAQKFHLTPKQVRTLITLAGAGKVQSDAIAIGRLYNLTPKQVRTLISQAGMDSSQAQIRRLASLYHLTPKQVRTIVTADTSNAAGAIARIRAMLAGIPRSISTSYYVNQVNSVSKAPLNFSPGHQATGGSVPKDGGPYADRYPYLLAPGEEVISNKHGQADRHRSLLKAINAGHLAGGGTAGFGPWNIHNPFQVTPGGATSGWHGAVWPSSPWGPLHASTQALNAAIKSTSASLKDHTKTLAADKTALSNLQAAASSLRDAVQGQFTGTNFNAGVAADPTTGQAYVSDLQAQESTMFSNRVTSDRFLTDLKALKKLGISGPAFIQLAQSNDVTLLDQLVEGGRGEVAHYNSLLAQQNASANAVGNYAGTAGYGADIKAQAATNKELADVVKLLTAELARFRKDVPKDIGKQVHTGAASGTHAGITGKAKTQQHKTRNTPKGA